MAIHQQGCPNQITQTLPHYSAFKQHYHGVEKSVVRSEDPSCRQDDKERVIGDPGRGVVVMSDHESETI